MVDERVYERGEGGREGVKTVCQKVFKSVRHRVGASECPCIAQRTGRCM